jgi:hypothetical protein
MSQNTFKNLQAKDIVDNVESSKALKRCWAQGHPEQKTLFRTKKFPTFFLSALTPLPIPVGLYVQNEIRPLNFRPS